MRNLIFMTAIIVCTIVTFDFYAFAAPQPGKTVQECATLLPKGKSYTYTIKGTIDTSGEKPIMHGSFNVGEAMTQSVATSATDTEGFVSCVKSLIRNKSF